MYIECCMCLVNAHVFGDTLTHMQRQEEYVRCLLCLSASTLSLWEMSPLSLELAKCKTCKRKQILQWISTFKALGYLSLHPKNKTNSFWITKNLLKLPEKKQKQPATLKLGNYEISPVKLTSICSFYTLWNENTVRLIWKGCGTLNNPLAVKGSK